jgi:hypothetical protein
MIHVHLATFVAVVRARGRDRSSRELHHVPDTQALVDETDGPSLHAHSGPSRHASPLDPPLDFTPPESSS